MCVVVLGGGIRVSASLARAGVKGPPCRGVGEGKGISFQEEQPPVEEASVGLMGGGTVKVLSQTGQAEVNLTHQGGKGGHFYPIGTSTSPHSHPPWKTDAHQERTMEAVQDNVGSAGEHSSV